VGKSDNQLPDFDLAAERASHDLPDQIARARARFYQYRDVIERLQGHDAASWQRVAAD
jgi:hypothetical protein